MDYTQQEHPPEKGATVPNGTATHRMRDDLKAYQDGEVSPLRRWWVGRHLEKCAACRAEITVLQRLERDMQEIERAVPSPQLRTRILASLPEAPPVLQPARPLTAKARPSFGTAGRPMLAIGSVCAVLLLMVGALALTRWQHTVKPENNTSTATTAAPSSGGPAAPDDSQTNTDGSAYSAARSADPAHAPLDPFSPVNTSAAPEASAHSSRIASETTGTHLSSQSFSGASVTVTTANGEAYTDPTSRAAEELASRTLPDKLEAERRNAAAPVLQPVRFVQQAPKVKNGVAESTQVAFAVADVSEARRQVQRWAEETGAKVTAISSRTVGVGSGVEASAGMPASSGAVGPNFVEAVQSPTLLKIQIPVQQAERFKAALSDMGTPLIPAKNALRRFPRAAMVQDGMAENSVRALAAPVPIEGLGQRDAKATVTILVRLQACSPLPR